MGPHRALLLGALVAVLLTGSHVRTARGGGTGMACEESGLCSLGKVGPGAMHG